MHNCSHTIQVRGNVLVWVLPVLTAVVAMLLIVQWLGYTPPMSFSLRLPDPNDAGPVGGQAATAEIKGTLLKFNGVPADIAGDWPRFRGVNMDAIISDAPDLAREWPADGPRVLWTIDVGEGYAGAAVRDGSVYIMDYDRQEQSDVIRCVSLADGADIWQYRYPVSIKRNHGMSRTIPTVTDRHVVAFGPKCHVTCLDSATGELKWMIDLVREHGAEVPAWYAGQCPLVEDNKAILAVGGHSLLMAVDCDSGEVLWRTDNPRKWVMTHSSVVPMDFNGQRQYLYCASGGVVGVSATDGQILWEYPDWKIRIANVPTPLIVGDGRVFLSGGYNAGCMMLQLKSDAGQIVPQALWRLDAAVFGSEQQTPVLYQGHIYGVRPDKQLACLDLDGNLIWTSGNAHKFGLGPYMIANGVLYVMDDDGRLTMTPAAPTGFAPLDDAVVLQGHESWGPMALVGTRLIVRDLTKMACLDIGRQP